MGFVVAVDGPAGSGKGTITKEIAENICCVKGKMNGLRRP